MRPRQEQSLRFLTVEQNARNTQMITLLNHALPLDASARVHSPHQDKLRAKAWPVNLKKKRDCSRSIDIRALRPGSKGKKERKKICANITGEKIYHDHTTYFLLPLLFFKIYGSISQSPLRGLVKISELSLIPRAFTYEN